MVTSAPIAPAPTSSPKRRGGTTRLCALRGATTVENDSRTEVTAAVREMVSELMRSNALSPDQILSAIFSATPDVRSLYPAAVAREMGWSDVPMLCVSEMPVDGSLARCVRVLLHISVTDDRRPHPCYMRGARTLRPDLDTASG